MKLFVPHFRLFTFRRSSFSFFPIYNKVIFNNAAKFNSFSVKFSLLNYKRNFVSRNEQRPYITYPRTFQLVDDLKGDLLPLINKCYKDKFNSGDISLKIFELIKSKKDDLNFLKQFEVLQYNQLIEIFGITKNFRAGIEVFEFMNENNISSNNFTFSILAKLCAKSKNLAFGRKLYHMAQKKKLTRSVNDQSNSVSSDPFLEISFLHMFGNCGDIDTAKQIFDKMESKDQVSYTILMNIYIDVNDRQNAFQLFHEMVEKGIKFDSFTFVSLLKLCTKFNEKVFGQRIFELILKSEELTKPNVKLETALVHMLCFIGDLEKARELFNKMHVKTLNTYSVLITGYIENNEFKAPFDLFCEMIQKNMKVDAHIFTSIIKLAKILRNKEIGKFVNDMLLKRGTSILSDVKLETALLDMYCSFGDMQTSRLIFDRMKVKHLVTYNILLNGYFQNKEYQNFFDLFLYMLQNKLEPSSTIFLSAIHLCQREKNLSFGKSIYQEFSQKETLSWSNDIKIALTNMFYECGDFETFLAISDSTKEKNRSINRKLKEELLSSSLSQRILDLVNFMINQKIEIWDNNLISLLKLCKDKKNLELRKKLYDHTVSTKMKNGLKLRLARSFIQTFCECGDIPSAVRVFDSVQNKDLIVYNYMLRGFSNNRSIKEVFDLFDTMLQNKVDPDANTFSSLLDACSHSGLVDEALKYFDLMQKKFQIQPSSKHCDLVVDLLRRANKLEEAKEFRNKFSQQIAENKTN